MATLAHGTRGAYRGGCRCLKCKAWKAEDIRKYRERRAAGGAAPRVAVQAKTPANVGRPTTAVKGARIPGEIERELRTAFKTIADDGNPWTKPLQMSALKLASSADEATPEVAARLIPQLLAMLERLGLTPQPPSRPGSGARTANNQLDGVPDDDDAAFIAGLRSADGGTA
jgi:hypothetical protein